MPLRVPSIGVSAAGGARACASSSSRQPVEPGRRVEHGAIRKHFRTDPAGTRQIGYHPPMSRRDTEAADRFAERRRREDAAPRLSEVVPRLESLRLELREARGGAALSGMSHVRPVVVERAPALFELVCQDPSCRDGGHDITWPVLRALKEGVERFEGDDACRGQVGSADCRRVLQYVAIATYRK
jgi:hypothetical protein